MFLARVNGEGGKIFIEANVEDVVTNLARIEDGEILNLEYWNIKDGPNLTLQKVNVKAGVRSAGVVTEVVEIEAAGEVIGSAERDV